MAKKKAKAAGPSRPKSRARKPAASELSAAAARLPPATAAEIAKAKNKFEQGVLARGEAVPANQPLPRGATHEIVATVEGGQPILKRKRFSQR